MSGGGQATESSGVCACVFVRARALRKEFAGGRVCDVDRERHGPSLAVPDPMSKSTASVSSHLSVVPFLPFRALLASGLLLQGSHETAAAASELLQS